MDPHTRKHHYAQGLIHPVIRDLIRDAVRPTFGFGGAVSDILFWLTNVLNLTTTKGSGPAVFDRGTSTATVESWDATTVLKLITTGADGIASRGLRYAAGVWYNDDGSGNKLHPTKTVEGADVYLQYEYWTTSDAVTAGDNRYIVGTDGFNYALTATNSATTGGSLSVAKTDIGSTVSDGVVTWDVDSYYSGLASATANFLPGLLHEPVAVNLALQSQDFSTTWVPALATVTTDSTAAPDGNTTADTLSDDSSTGTGVVYIAQSFTVANSTDYVFSCFAKEKQLSWVSLATSGFTSPANGLTYFNLANGSIGTTAAGHTPSIEKDIDGFYRPSISFTTDVADTAGELRIYVVNGDNDPTVDLDGTSDIYLWQADLVAASAVSSPIATTTGSVQRNASTETSPHVFSAQFIRCRATGNLLPSEVLYSDGTNILNWDGTDVTFTDGSATLTSTFALAKNDDIVVDTTDGKLYINGALKDTDGTISVTWGALTDIGNISDLAESFSFDPTDQTWKA